MPPASMASLYTRGPIDSPAIYPPGHAVLIQLRQYSLDGAVDARNDSRAVAMSMVKCELCRTWYLDGNEHACPGLRSVDWARFMRSMRDWMHTDPHARFEVFYARRRQAADEP
jgi:hypothetical protein